MRMCMLAIVDVAWWHACLVNEYNFYTSLNLRTYCLSQWDPHTDFGRCFSWQTCTISSTDFVKCWRFPCNSGDNNCFHSLCKKAAKNMAERRRITIAVSCNQFREKPSVTNLGAYLMLRYSVRLDEVLFIEQLHPLKWMWHNMVLWNIVKEWHGS